MRGLRTDRWARRVLHLPQSQIPRVLAAFAVVWLWVILAYMGMSLSDIEHLWVWAFVGIASLFYLVVVGVPVCVLLHHLRKHSIVAYVLGALLAGTPIVLIFLMMWELPSAGYAVFVATIGGIIGYCIVEGPSRRQG